MLSWVKHMRAITAAAVLVVAVFVALPTQAAPYGSGKYGLACGYGCAKITAASQPQTTVTSSSGFKATINLSNGQKIPGSGYTVVVQPANNQSTTIQSAAFYLNGTLEYTGTPNEVGAVRWLWLPTQTSGSATIKVIVTASDGSISIQEFTVSIGTPETPTPTATTTPQQPTDPVSTVSRAVLGFVSTLPTPVLYGAPYFLFALLMVNILLLLWQTQRELRELAVLQRIITLERKTGLEKNTFISLTSHYLRTPISIMQGGLDLLAKQNAAAPDALQRAQQIVEALRLKVNDLLAQTDNNPANSDMPVPEKLPNIWKSPGLYVPILLIGLLALVFNYIAAHVESFSVGQLNGIVQIVAYALLATVFYQVFRRRQLRRRDTMAMQQALTHQQTINQTRDDFIAASVQLLSNDLSTLQSITTSLPASQASQFVRDGIQRFSEVLVKFSIAARLKGDQSNGPVVQTSLGQLLGMLPSSLQNMAAQKAVTITAAKDATFAVQNPKWVAYVLASLIDNAIEYSQANQQVEVRANATPDGVAISVTDHGNGIDAQKMALLFKPFSQTQDVERFTHEGMGFSLYLDKLIMTYLGGTISLNSNPGVETAATITLPAAA